MHRSTFVLSFALAVLVPVTLTGPSGSTRQRASVASLVLLLGDQRVESSVASLPGGGSEAFPFKAARSGEARQVRWYLGKQTRASHVILAVYSSASGRPHQLLTTGSRRPDHGAWNTIAVQPVSLNAGNTYWLAVFGTGGAIHYRDRSRGSCSSSLEVQRGLKSLPRTWRSGGHRGGCPASAYLLGTPSGKPGKPPMPPVASVPSAPPPLPCTSTLGSGANVSEAIDHAPDGTVICLQTGSYQKISLTRSYHSHYVTVQAAPGATPTVDGLYAVGASFLRLRGLSMASGIDIRSDGHDLQFIGNDISNTSFGIAVDAYGSDVTHILIEDNYIHDLDTGCATPGYATGQGVTLSGGEALIIGNTFQTIAEHYIQGGDNTTVAWNVFEGPVVACPTAHLNVWQIWSGGRNDAFIGNILRPGLNASNTIMFETGPGGTNPNDALTDITISDNLFDHESTTYSIQVCQISGLTITNNTMVGSGYGLWVRDCSGTGSNYNVSHNIVVQNTYRTPEIEFDGCTGSCVFDYNVTDDNSAHQAGASHFVTHWSPRWSDALWYQPLGLPFAAGLSNK